MLARKKLLAIKEIQSPENTWQTNDNEMVIFAKKLLAFIDELPACIDAARTAWKGNDLELILKTVNIIKFMLIKIDAKEMAEEKVKSNTELRAMDMAEIEAYLEDFFSAVNSLSIKIQMALYNKVNEEKIVQQENDKQPSILAVDDSPFALRHLKACLDGSKYKLICVPSGNEALRFLEKNRVSLLIMDIEMPEMDGYQTLGHIRRKGILTPVVFLTGNAKKEYVNKAMEVGAADFIVKPINKDMALEKIAMYI